MTEQTKKRETYTHRLCTALVWILVMGLVMGFLLALYSIHEQYMGALECWTIVFTPIGAGINIVLTAAVNKSKQENTSKDGDGIKYALAMKSEEHIV